MLYTGVGEPAALPGDQCVHRAVRAIIRNVKPEGTRAELNLARHAITEWTKAGKPGRPE
jgi:hypothetical protein